jgi:hypothetical protein
VSDVIDWQAIQKTISDGHLHWRDLLNERQKATIDNCRGYAKGFHGPLVGANYEMVIAIMEQLLDSIQAGITFHTDDKDATHV